MENLKPVLTNFHQVVGLEKLQQMETKEFLFKSPIDWGPDRIVSLRHNDTIIKDQWNGTCTTFATIAAMENKLKAQHDLSERSLWNFYGVFTTTQAIKAAQIFYVLEEKYWPQFQQKFDTKYSEKGRFIITDYEDIENDYLRVLKAIDNENPCVVALKTPVDLYKGKPQVEKNSKIYKKGGHAMCVSGYKVENGRGYFLVKNSWGIRNGDNGYQYIAFNVFDGKGYVNFWEIKNVFDRGEQHVELEDNAESLTSFIE